MTINDVFGLRNQGRAEEAYEAARSIYAVDKRSYSATAMFWTAVDVLKLRVSENRMEEARKIYLALERLLNGLKDEKGWMHDAMEKCQALLEKGNNRERLLEEGPEHLRTGIWGEELAAAYLREKGYVILERDWHSKHRDIDIIAQNDGYIVFVEVKTRRNCDYADPVEAVNYQKLKNLRLAINHYLNYRKTDSPWRFDVITIIGSIGDLTPEINHIEEFSLI